MEHTQHTTLEHTTLHPPMSYYTNPAATDTAMSTTYSPN